MIYYITSIFKYIFGSSGVEEDDNDECKEHFLAEQLFDLEIQAEKDQIETGSIPTPELLRGTSCFQRTGIITYIDDKGVLIDGMLYFDLSETALNLNVEDKVVYLGFNNTEESVIVVRILQNLGRSWGENEVEEDTFKVIDHVIVGQVDFRTERYVNIKDSDLKFSLDEVEGTFVPVKGDWLELRCTVQFDEKKPTDISATQVLQVKSFQPLRRTCIHSKITEWSGEEGVCDRKYYFQTQHLHNNVQPQVGGNVFIEAIESNQGKYEWRAIKVIIDEYTPAADVNIDTTIEIEQQSLTTEKEHSVGVTHPVNFNNIHFNTAPSTITLNITNNSDTVHFINKWIILSKKKDSQVHISPFLARPIKLCPKDSFCLNITCQPKFLGKTKEHLIIFFRGFQVDRFIGINVVADNIQSSNTINCTRRAESENINLMKQIRRDINSRNVIPGVRLSKPPNFVSVRLGVFPIPERVWSAILGVSQETLFSRDQKEHVTRIESLLPCLAQDLDMNNYNDKWHMVMFMEEIQANINMRTYDVPKVFLLRSQEYLGLEINDLCERRPSLIKGDKVIVKDTWNPGTPNYEGYIHVIKGNLVLIKFNPQFHESYTGSDVSIEFQLSRTPYRRCHNAINLAISNLGPNVLFPSRINSRPYQVAPETIETIQWYNTLLNEGQKAAVTNILLGECRPTPYCIYGPPGTGKTVTVIETILQILTLIPDSRILITTPSNSAANLITERLIQYREKFPTSITRIIAHYLVDSESIPDGIKPYCASITTGRDETHKYSVHKGVHTNCKKSFIERHRVIIGTCFGVGMLAQMGLSRGHFTHIIVDEAGQALEPEIMIPLTFTDKNGQIILAGDPMQLGPIAMSKYCIEFGITESYLSRILDTFPYQKDFSAFPSGFNNKLVTKLNDNYRSLKEVLKLPSEMFYDATLNAKFDITQPWVENILNVVSELFEMDTKTGGIFMYGIRGQNLKSEDSPSWYNPQEASMVTLTVCKLYKKGIQTEDIGIITPYIAQTRYIRTLLDAMGLSLPKIGTVEAFQGQERPIMLISTVRSTETHLIQDQKHFLGFVKSPKRLNVALTRAQVAAILFCDPHLLSKDVLWRQIVNHAVETDKYMGCDLPYDCSQTSNVNVK